MNQQEKMVWAAVLSQMRLTKDEVEEAIEEADAQVKELRMQEKIQEEWDDYGTALEEMEKIGWPCRFVELPALYDKLSRQNARLKRELETCKATLVSHEQDTRDAATELRVDIPEPGTEKAKLLKSAVLSRRRATAEEEKNLNLLREIDGYREVIKSGLRSMDAKWEEDNAGHDWADWCDLARASLEMIFE